MLNTQKLKGGSTNYVILAMNDVPTILREEAN